MTEMTRINTKRSPKAFEFAEFGEMTEMSDLLATVDPKLSAFAEFGEMTEMSELIPGCEHVYQGSRLLCL